MNRIASITATTAVAFGAALMLAGPARADIKIGFSGPLSGPQAGLGQDQYDAFMLALEKLGGKLGGQAAVVLKEDDQVKPEIGNQIVQKYVEKEKVDVLVGLGFSNVLMGSLPRIVDSGTVAIATNAGPSPIAGARCAPNVFSVAWQNDGAAEATGKLLQDKGYRRVYLMAPNYQAGKDVLAGFKRLYKGEIADEVYTQINQPDYSAEITRIQAEAPDALFVFYPGGMGVNFVKQLSQAGLLGKIPFYSVYTVDGITLPAIKGAAAGAVSVAMYDAALELPENKAFVAAFEARYKRTPSQYAAIGFDAANLLDAAVRKVGGKVSDQKALAAAVKAAGTEFRSVRGPFSFNSNNFPIQNYYAFQMSAAGGKVAARQVATPLTSHKDAYFTACGLK
jgi:branched-chain amino acid transport system substrate-binding protein